MNLSKLSNSSITTSDVEPHISGSIHNGYVPLFYFYLKTFRDVTVNGERLGDTYSILKYLSRSQADAKHAKTTHIDAFLLEDSNINLYHGYITGSYTSISDIPRLLAGAENKVFRLRVGGRSSASFHYSKYCLMTTDGEIFFTPVIKSKHIEYVKLCILLNEEIDDDLIEFWYDPKLLSKKKTLKTVFNKVEADIKKQGIKVVEKEDLTWYLFDKIQLPVVKSPLEHKICMKYLSSNFIASLSGKEVKLNPKYEPTRYTPVSREDKINGVINGILNRITKKGVMKTINVKKSDLGILKSLGFKAPDIAEKLGITTAEATSLLVQAGLVKSKSKAVKDYQIVFEDDSKAILDNMGVKTRVATEEAA